MENNLKQQFKEFCKEQRSEEPVIVKVGLKPRPLTEKLKAIYKMILCAKFLNKGESKEEWSFYLLEGTAALYEQTSFITFESQEAGEQAYDILGEELILKALL